MNLDPQEMLQGAARQVTSQGGGFLQGLIGSPLNAIGGFAKKILSLQNLISGAWIGAAIAATQAFLPDLWYAGVRTFGGPEATQKAIREREEGGPMGLVFKSLLQGEAISSAWSGLTGAVDGVQNGFSPGEKDHGNHLGAMVGGAIAIVGIGAVAIGALHKNGIQLTGNGDHSPKSAPATPAAPSTGPSKA